MLNKVVFNFWVCGRHPKVWPYKWKFNEQYFPVVLCIMLYKMILTFESVDKILKCDHSNESYWAVLSCGTVYYGVPSDSSFWVYGWNPKVWPFKWKLLSSTPVVLSIMVYQVILAFESVNKILKCDHSNDSYQAVLSCGAVDFDAVQSGSGCWAWRWNASCRAVFTCGVFFLIMLFKELLFFESVPRWSLN